MDATFLNIALYAAFAFLLIGLALSLWRLIQGPTVQDRIVALDLIASITMGFTLVYSVLINNPMYLDIVIILSLISFIGTVAISTYLKQNND